MRFIFRLHNWGGGGDLPIKSQLLANFFFKLPTSTIIDYIVNLVLVESFFPPSLFKFW